MIVCWPGPVSFGLGCLGDWRRRPQARHATLSRLLTHHMPPEVLLFSRLANLSSWNGVLNGQPARASSESLAKWSSNPSFLDRPNSSRKNSHFTMNYTLVEIRDSLSFHFSFERDISSRIYSRKCNFNASSSQYDSRIAVQFEYDNKVWAIFRDMGVLMHFEYVEFRMVRFFIETMKVAINPWRRTGLLPPLVSKLQCYQRPTLRDAPMRCDIRAYPTPVTKNHVTMGK